MKNIEEPLNREEALEANEATPGFAGWWRNLIITKAEHKLFRSGKDEQDDET
jgi:hypothetical protein